MKIVTPVLQFNGQCEEAIEFYKNAFGAEVKTLKRYSDTEPQDFLYPITEEEMNYIQFAEMYIGKQRIVMTDIIGYKVAGDSIFLAVTFDTDDEVKEAYDKLKDGSLVISPMNSTSYSTCIISIIDKFDKRWTLLTEK